MSICEMNLMDCRQIIRPLLSEKRYYHSLCVSEAAAKLAEQSGADVAKAQISGILHDIMKDVPRMSS